jgi:signal transduction histidine kinase
VPGDALSVWSFFVAGALSVAIVVAAFLVALVLSQRRRLAEERAHAQRVLAAQEEERARVARELHDDALQRVALVRHEIADAALRAAPELAHRLGGIAGELEDLGVVLRTAAHQLHPSIVEKAGLPRALGALGEEFGRAAGLTVRVRVPPGAIACAPAAGLAVYRIAQEALRNVVRHAGVPAAELSLEATPQALVLRIADEGRGFEAERGRASDGLGLVAMRQRAEGAGGRLTVEARPGGGTVVTATIPAEGSR